MTPPLFVPALGRSLYPGASVALDFTRNLYRSGTPVVKGSPSLLSGWTFTRASTGYAETAAGALVAFASGAPRITDKGLLVEEARTNIALQSQALATTPWGASASSVSVNTTTAPDGTLTADKLVEDSATSTHGLQQFLAYSNATAYTMSGYFKAAERSWVWLFYPSGAFTTTSGCYFNIGAGAVGTVIGSGVTASIQAMGDGWYRCSITKTSTAAASGNTGFGTATADNTNSYAGNGTSGIQAWGLQIEAGAFATSYIPTTTASATRAADVPDIINGITLPAAYTLYVEARVQDVRIGGFPSFNGFVGSSISVGMFINGSSGAPGATMGGATYNNSFGGSVPVSTLGAVVKAAFRAETNNANGASGGGIGTVDATFTPSTGLLSHFYIGASSAAAAQYNGYIRQVVIYPTAFTDAALRAATA